MLRVSTHDQFSYNSTIRKAILMDSIKTPNNKRIRLDSDYIANFLVNNFNARNERQQMGLPPIEEEIKMMKFNWENKTEFILGSSKTEGYWVTDIKSFEFFKEIGQVIIINEKKP